MLAPPNIHAYILQNMHPTPNLLSFRHAHEVLPQLVNSYLAFAVACVAHYMVPVLSPFNSDVIPRATPS